MADSFKLQITLGFGDNTYGKLGLGHVNKEEYETKPQLTINKNIIQIASGKEETLFLTENRKRTILYRVSTKYHENPIPIQFKSVKIYLNDDEKIIPIEQIEIIIQISAGADNFLILNESGRVFAYGQNSSGQLGDKNTIWTRIPQIVRDLPKIKQISAGGAFSLVVGEDNRVYSFGNNCSGQLGLGHELDPGYLPPRLKYLPPRLKYLPPKLKQRTPMMITFRLDGERISPIIKEISAGEKHVLILTENGVVYSFGNNDWGQLGIKNRISQYSPVLIDTLIIPGKIKSVKAGHTFSLVLTENGFVYSFGSNNNGELGIGQNIPSKLKPVLIRNINNVIQICVGQYNSMILDNNGLVYLFGRRDRRELDSSIEFNRNIPLYIPTLIPNLKDIINIFSGYLSSFVTIEKNLRR